MSKEFLEVARGVRKADICFKNANIINVFTESIETADLAIYQNRIAGIGSYKGNIEIDCSDKYIAPGFLDGHIHIESSMLKPAEFAKAVLPHGTTGIVTDPHEIANVSGTIGIQYMMEASDGLPLDVYFVLPSCVPATPIDESGSVLLAKDLEPFYDSERVVGLAEVMNYIGTVQGDADILEKIAHAKRYKRIVDGHGPGLKGKDICAYVGAGVMSDHECSFLEEALEKLKRGQWIMIREGTAAKNLDALMPLFKPPFHNRCMLVTDDKHPFDLLEYGHMDYMIRKAIANGADPVRAVKMATFNTASYFGLRDKGAIAPGFDADLVILSNLDSVEVESVYKGGEKVYEKGADFNIDASATSFAYTDFGMPVNQEVEKESFLEAINHAVYHSFHCDTVSKENFLIQNFDVYKESGYPVIQLVKGEILTEEIRIDVSNIKNGLLEDVVKLAVIERHHNTGHIGLGLVKGFGLKRGAIASSVSHDSHNLIVIGASDADMEAAANRLIEIEGGIAIALDGKIIGELPLPIAGLMSDLDAKTLSKNIHDLKKIAETLDIAEGIDPFMTLAFISLPVIPKLRLTTRGLVDVDTQKLL